MAGPPAKLGLPQGQSARKGQRAMTVINTNVSALRAQDTAAEAAFTPLRRFCTAEVLKKFLP